MDTTQLLKGVVDVAVLAAIKDDEGYGFDIVRRLQSAGLVEVGDASIYGTLRRLYTAGVVLSDVAPSDWVPHRKYSSVNAQGRQMLADQRRSWAAFVDTMSELLVQTKNHPQLRTIGEKS